MNQTNKSIKNFNYLIEVINNHAKIIAIYYQFKTEISLFFRKKVKDNIEELYLGKKLF